MPKIVEKWVLFQYVSGKCVPLSKPFKTKQLAERERAKYPERERRRIGLGLIRVAR